MAIALSGCAVSPPYVFVERPARSASAANGVAGQDEADAHSLPAVLALADQAQRQWAASAREAHNLHRGTSMSLLLLGFAALLKGVTSPNARDLAGLGAVSAGTYAWSSVAVSSARPMLYREGIATMACAVGAVTAYDDPAWLGGKGRPTLETLSDDAAKALVALESALTQLRQLPLPETPPKTPLPAFCRGTAPDCQPHAGTTHEAACLDSRREWQRRCTPAAAAPPRRSAAIDAALASGREEADALRRAASDLTLRRAEIGRAASWLRQTGIRIENNVRDALEKSEPSLEAVLAISQSLKAGGSPPTGGSAAPITPSTGAGHSGAVPGVAASPELTQVETAQRAAALQRLALEERLALLRAALAGSSTAACRSALPLAAGTPPDGGATTAGATQGAPTVAPISGSATPTADLPDLAQVTSRLGLPAGAPLEDVVGVLSRCERSQLGRTAADGRRVDGTLRALVDGGRCRGL